MYHNINKNKIKLSMHYKTDDNKIKISKSNTFIHEVIKSCVCKIIRDKGNTFVTEARFTSMDRADVFDLSEGVVYEIVNSESNESIDLKRERYPVRELIIIRTKDYENNKLCEIERNLSKIIL